MAAPHLSGTHPVTHASRSRTRRGTPVVLAALAAFHAALAPHAVAQATSAEITAADLRHRVGILAHDSMAGRQTGTPGILKARGYLAAELARLGLRPAGDGGTFFHRVPLERSGYAFSARLRGAAGDRALTTEELVPLSGTAGVPGDPRPAGEGPLVYGGYMVDDAVAAASEPTAEQLRGSVLLLRWGAAPGLGAMPRERFDLDQLWSPASPLAAVVIVAEADAAGFWDTGLELVRSGSLARAQAAGTGGGGPPVFLVRPALAERLIGQPLATARQPKAGLGTLRYELRATRTPVEAWNVAAVLPGSDPRRAGQYVALGAHYDHDGIGAAVAGDSVYNGADDDGSGTSALLEIAERLARGPASARPARSLLFVWHTAEEHGLLGSEAFTERPTVPRDSIVAQLNLDMIGRNVPDSLYLVGSRRLSTGLGDLVEAVNRRQPRPLRFDYSWDAPGHPEQIYCRSDHYSYARFGIPVTFFTSGLHADYHKPSDEPETLDYEKTARVTRLVGDVAAEVGSLPTRLAVDRPIPPLGAPCQ